MTIKIKNNAINNITVGINTTDTTFTVADGSLFPVIDTDEYFYCTLQNNTDIEIVKVIEKVGNTLTVEREQDNTTAKSFPENTKIELRLNVAQLNDFIGDKVKDNHNDLENRDIAGNHAKLIPETDSTTAVQITKANGTTPILNVDTVNNNVGIGTSTPTSELEVVGDIISQGTSWTIRTSAVDHAWRSVCYGNGLFVAVSNTGQVGRVMTSPDGINWISRTGGLDEDWNAVCYGNGLFVAVNNTGLDDRVMTSPDGVNWTSRAGGVNNSWVSVCYGNGLFVAVAGSGSGNRVMTSPDGINWTLRESAADNDWRSVCYGNGLFVAVSNTGTGNRVMTSGKQEVDEQGNTALIDPVMYGNVGIGTTTPASILHLRKDIADYGSCRLRIENDDFDGDTGILLFSNGLEAVNMSANRDGLEVYVDCFDGMGNVRWKANWFFVSGIYNTTVTNARDVQVNPNGLLGYVSSTRESKNNIDYNPDTSWIHQLKPVSFEYRKQDEDGNYIDETDGVYSEGLIAEDVNEVRPEMVYKDDDGTLRGVDYKYVIASLLKEVQELNKRIQILESKEGNK